MGLLDDPELQQLLQSIAVNDQQKKAARMHALSQAGFAMMGTRKGQEGAGLGRAGLIGTQSYQNQLADARGGNMQMFQLQQLLAKQRAAQAEAQRRQQGMDSAYHGAVQQPVGPPAPDGSMPPPGFDMGRYAQGVMGVDPKLGLDAFKTAATLQPPSTAEKSPWAQINPKDYDPESLREFARTKDPSVLRARVEPKAPESPFTKVSPGDFTPTSLAKYAASGNFADLVPIDKSTKINIDVAPKLSPHHRWKDGMVGQAMEPIPGGPADSSAADAAKATGTATRAQLVLDSITDAKKLVGFRSAGLPGSIAAKIPGTSAVDLRKRIDTIKANIGFQELQTMRDQSKTGGALGQVAVQELNMLQSVIASLDAEQSPAQLKDSLDRVEKHFKNATMILERIGKGERGQGAAPKTVDFSDLPE
jgi:hypothetical protein